MRPKTFKDYYGFDKLKKYFYSCAKDKSWPTAVLLHGNFGTGKTTAAQIAAQMMVCQNPDDEGNPCCECPSCKAIIEEKFNRDVMQIDGGQAGKDEVVTTVSDFVATPPWKDSHKIVILEEVQELSTKAKNSLLKLIETRRPNIHYIFTSMEDMKASGLTSRCVNFKFPRATTENIMYFLKSACEKTGIWTDQTVPQDFKMKGLYLIAANAEGSYRQALQVLQQCWKTRTFDEQAIKSEFGLVDIANFYDVLLKIENGEVDDVLYNTLINGDYLQSYNLVMKVIADAECYRIFGDVSGRDTDNDWWHSQLINQAKKLSDNPNYPILRDGLMKVQAENVSYVKKSSYLIGICKIIDECLKNKPNGVTKFQENAAPSPRRIIK